jgi:hypothetical protein
MKALGRAKRLSGSSGMMTMFHKDGDMLCKNGDLTGTYKEQRYM